LHRSGARPGGLARADDEPRRPVGRADPGHVVVVHPAGRGHHRHRWLPLPDERRPRRGVQPQAERDVRTVTLQVSDLKVYYRTLRGDVKALDGVTFGLTDGEIMGLAGESGCGKSTLSKSLIR